MASPRAAISVTWGEVTLADVVVTLPCRWADALRETSVRSDRVASFQSGSDGSIELRSADGALLARAPRGESACWNDHDLSVRFEASTERDEALPADRADRAWWRSLAVVAFAVISLCTWSVSRPGNDANDRDRLAALSHLVARTVAAPSESRDPQPAPVQPAAAADNGPSEALPDTRLARADTVHSWMRAPADVSDASRLVASRGVLGLTAMTPQLARAMRNTLGAIASMDGAPIEGVGPMDDRVHYGAMTAGIGAGGGCPPGADCDPVTVRVSVGDSWRPRAASLAHAAMQARTTSAPVIHAAPPEMGELTMAYVQQRIRRDLLADVQRCYNDRLEQTPDLASGRVVVRFEVSTDGTVREAAIVTSAIANPEIEQCITHVLHEAHFPTNETGARVTYPFVFSSLMPDR